jgi:ubiquitin fusion degradation protein 1
MSICHPEHLEGGKIICPPQVLNAITKSEVVYPILFKISSNTKTLYCGPVDWTAEPGRVYVPDWMMANLGVENNSKIQLSVTELPTGHFVKFKPQSTNFLTKISDPRAVLEHKLRNYAALKVGEVIYFQYVKHDYFLEVLECKPASHGAISIIEANLEVDFAPPDGYVEPSSKSASSSSASPAPPFAMEEDDPNQAAEEDDLGLGADSEDDSDDDNGGAGKAGRRSTSSKGRSKTPSAFSGQGHRPSGKAVTKTELSLPDLASSPSGRKFITSSGSLVIGPPSESASASSSSSASSSATNARGSPSPAAAAAAARAAASSSSSKPSTPQPSANNPVAAAETKPEPTGFVAFSGAGHRLK